MLCASGSKGVNEHRVAGGGVKKEPSPIHVPAASKKDRLAVPKRVRTPRKHLTPLEEHLKFCKIDKKSLPRLNKILKSIRRRTRNQSQFVWKFGMQCWSQESDENIRVKSAEEYLEALYGSVDAVWVLGPEDALARYMEAILSRTHSDAMSINTASTDADMGSAELAKRASSAMSSEAPPAGQCRKPADADTAVPTRARADGVPSEADRYLDQARRIMEASKSAGQKSQWQHLLGHVMIGGEIGSGGCSEVRMGLDLKTNQEVAVKIMNEEHSNEATKEYNILNKLDHINIVKAITCFPGINWLGRVTQVFVCEYAPNGEAIEYLMYAGKLDLPLVRWMLKQLVAGLQHCKDRGIVHRDMKHDNILFGEGFILKIADFGFGTQWRDGQPKMEEYVGTEGYAAPEILQNVPYTDICDVFSLGVMTYMAVFGRIPFKKAVKKEDPKYINIAKNNWKNYWAITGNVKARNDVKDIIQRLLCHDPNRRIKLHEIPKTPFWKGRTYSNDQAKRRFFQLKRLVDEAKRKVAPSGGYSRGLTRSNGKAPVPMMYWAQEPKKAWWFPTMETAETVQQALNDVITASDMGGKVWLPKAKKSTDEDDFSLDLSSPREVTDEDVLGAEDLVLTMSRGDTEELLGDGRPNKYKGSFKVTMSDTVVKKNGKKKKKDFEIEGEWRLYTEPLNPEERETLEQRYSMADKLENERELVRKRKLKELQMSDDYDDVPLAKIQSLAREAGKKHLENRMTELGISDLSQFYTERDRHCFKKRNFVVFTPKPGKNHKRFLKKSGIKKADYGAQYFNIVFQFIMNKIAGDLLIPPDETKSEPAVPKMADPDLLDHLPETAPTASKIK